MIRSIDARSVDQITSGQVITTLASALKELVENAVDAGASVVEVNVQNHGRDGFAVLDNGSGIATDDFHTVAKRHTTSKLASLSDLATVQTLGFRGEALASLCALGEVRITTSTGSGSGHEIEFDAEGTPKSVAKIARPKGTSVSVTNLFRNVPVRRRDFERNYQREFTKAVALLQEYALLLPVRLTLNHDVKNRHSTTLRSQGAGLLQRIASIYGASRTSKLMELDFELPDLSIQCKVAGYISKPVFGMGQASSDRQLIAINGRPSKQPKIVRAIVDVYKQFNLTEAPFFVLDLRMSPSAYDVNVTPDKRFIMLHFESEIAMGLRNALTVALNAFGHSVPRSKTQVPSPKRQKQSRVSFAAFSGSGSVIRQDTRDESSEEELEPVQDPEQGPEAESEEESEKESEADPEADPEEDPEENPEEDPEAILDENSGEEEADDTLNHAEQAQEAIISNSLGKPSRLPHSAAENDVVTHGTAAGTNLDFEPEVGEVTLETPSEPQHEPIPLHARHESGICGCGNTSSEAALDSGLPESSTTAVAEVNSGTETRVKEELVDGEELRERGVLQSSPERGEAPALTNASTNSSVPWRSSLGERMRPPSQPRSLNRHIHLPVSLSDIQSAKQRAGEAPNDMKKLRTLAIDETGAEERLSLTINKEDFAQMEIVGQFNLGFILVVNRKKNHDDLFVIDQHASDEIYNFERLQRTTVLSRQPLVAPHVLELSAVEELTIAENLGVFENNGFSIKVSPANPPGTQCALLSVPFSKNTVFDEKDVHELLSRVQEDPENKQVRCSKLRAMLAMRACRSSIMIGKPLSHSTMKRVVQHLGTLDKPWNCPHGRPTLRHITTLS